MFNNYKVHYLALCDVYSSCIQVLDLDIKMPRLTHGDIASDTSSITPCMYNMGLPIKYPWQLYRQHRTYETPSRQSSLTTQIRRVIPRMIRFNRLIARYLLHPLFTRQSTNNKSKGKKNGYSNSNADKNAHFPIALFSSSRHLPLCVEIWHYIVVHDYEMLGLVHPGVTVNSGLAFVRSVGLWDGPDVHQVAGSGFDLIGIDIVVIFIGKVVGQIAELESIGLLLVLEFCFSVSIIKLSLQTLTSTSSLTFAPCQITRGARSLCISHKVPLK